MLYYCSYDYFILTVVKHTYGIFMGPTAFYCIKLQDKKNKGIVNKIKEIADRKNQNKREETVLFRTAVLL